jgi:hypothetical protein
MKDYTWGSNKGKAIQARLYQLAALHNTDQRLSESSLAAAMECAHYIHGVKPLGLVYLTNMTPAGASHSAATMFHAWFARARAGNGLPSSFRAHRQVSSWVDPIRNFRWMRAVAHLLGRVHIAAMAQRRSHCASRISRRRWPSRRPNRIFNTITHRRRTRGRSRSGRCTTNPTTFDCSPPSPGDAAFDLAISSLRDKRASQSLLLLLRKSAVGRRLFAGGAVGFRFCQVRVRG